MDNTARMIRLLGRLRREMNGAVADAMRYYGGDYGLNYGVSLPTLRSIARAEGCDDAFARYLYVQQVRELRLAALHIADPALLSLAEAGFWGEGIINSEVAEEAAFAFLSRAEALPGIFASWCSSENELLAYAALMAGARARLLRDMPAAAESMAGAVACHPQSHLVGCGAAAMLGGALDAGDIVRERVSDLVAFLPEGRAATHVSEEMSWRMAED